jgi:hypothetical protein
MPILRQDIDESKDVANGESLPMRRDLLVLIDDCREAFWPILADYLGAHYEVPNRGPHRALLQRFSLTRTCCVLSAQQWTREWSQTTGDEIRVRGSVHQSPRANYRRPLFHAQPDLSLPTYMLVVNFALIPATLDNGPIEIAPGTHRIPRKEALRAVEALTPEQQEMMRYPISSE